MDEKDNGGLTAEEAAYFETGGEADLPQEPQTQEPDTATGKAAEGDQPETVDKQPEGQNRDERGRFVPHQALHAEREEHKKTRAELQEIRERQARLDERWQMLQRAPQPQQQEPELPDPEADPIAALKWTYDQIRNAREQNAKATAEQQQREQQESQVREVVNYVDGAYGLAVQEDETVKEAFEHAFGSYQKELEVLGWRGPQLVQQMNQLLLQFQLAAANRMQAGESLPDFIRGVAETRGWQNKAANAEPNLSLPDNLAKVAKAQDMSKTIGKVAGTAAADEVSLDMLDKMSGSEFEAWMAVPANASKFRRLMGG